MRPRARTTSVRRRSLFLVVLLLVPTSLLATPAVAQTSDDYVVEEVPFAPFALDTGRTPLTMGDNFVTSAFPLGFESHFFGTTIRDFWVGANGFVTLHFLTPDGCCGGDPIPTPGGPDGMVAALWTDLDPSIGGSISFQGTTLGGQRAMVVDYDGVPVKGRPLDTVSFQVHVYENGTIEIHYAERLFPTGFDITIGLENINGGRGVQVFHGAGDDSVDQAVALRFTPLIEPTPDPDPEPEPAQDYIVVDTPFDRMELSANATQLTLGDDFVTGAIPLGFETRFFGTATGEFWVGSNGFVALHFLTPDGCCAGSPIPTQGGPDGMIAAHWTDLDPSAGGEVAFDRISLDGQPALVVDFSQVPVKSANATASFQVLLFADGAIEFHYRSLVLPSGRGVTVGVENIDGTRGVELLHENGTESVLENVSVRLEPVTASQSDAYVVSEVTHAPIALAPGAGTTVTLGDDFVTSAFPLGFESHFFGTSTSEFWIGSNGFVTLHFLTPAGCCSGDPIPTPGGPDGMVALFWTDLDPGSGGTVRFDRFTTESGGALVVSYEDVPLFGGQDVVSFQLVFHQNGTFETHYIDATIREDHTVSIGAENIDGSEGIELFHGNGSALVVGNTTDNTTGSVDLIDAPVLDGRSFRFVPTFEPPATDPTIGSMDPTAGPPGTVVELTGTGFRSTARVFLGNVETPTTVLSDTRIDFVVPLDAVPGTFTVTVVNFDGTSVQASTAFRVTGADDGFLVEPGEARQGDVVTITALDFLFGPEVEVLVGDHFQHIVGSNATQIDVRLRHDLAPGVYDVSVHEPDGFLATVPDALVVRGRPDVAVVDVDVDRRDVATPITPDGTHATPFWTITATFANIGDLDADLVELRLIAEPADGFGPLKSQDPEVLRVAGARLSVDGVVILDTQWDGLGDIGDYTFRAEATVIEGVGDRDVSNNVGKSSDYRLIGGLGGIAPFQCAVLVMGSCPERTVHWQDHEEIQRIQTDGHSARSVRLDAFMHAPDFSFDRFDMVFTHLESFDDGSFEECTTWRFLDRPDGTFRVSMSPGNGIQGTIAFDGGSRFVFDGESFIDRNTQLVARAADREVVLFQTPPDRFFGGPQPAADDYVFQAPEPGTDEFFVWSAEFEGLTGDFTHCAFRSPAGGGSDTFVFADLPENTAAEVASLEGAGRADLVMVEVEAFERHVTERPVVDLP